LAAFRALLLYIGKHQNRTGFYYYKNGSTFLVKNCWVCFGKS